MRADGRAADQVRPLKITLGFTQAPAGSVLIEAGRSRLLCTASVTDQLPSWLQGTGSGWLTAEYSMLPGSSAIRKPRDHRAGKVDGRAQEIQRLIGRSLRAVTDLKTFPGWTVWLDCDALEADGGTRSLAITGAWVALHQAFTRMNREGALLRWPLLSQVAALSVGVVDGIPLLDLTYEEDHRAEVDLNVVMTAEGNFVEVQGSAERGLFSQARLQELLALAGRGIEEVLTAQGEALDL